MKPLSRTSSQRKDEQSSRNSRAVTTDARTSNADHAGSGCAATSWLIPVGLARGSQDIARPLALNWRHRAGDAVSLCVEKVYASGAVGYSSGRLGCAVVRWFSQRG